MKRITFLGVVVACGLLAAPVSAANITASGVISSRPDGADFDYTITLTNSSSSTSAVGTFWYAWNLPNVNYLATSPISVTPPSGWSDQITNAGPNDGFAILYTANSSASYLQPGSSLVFHFKSADTPAAINGDSVFYPGVPVNTSFVYPQGPFSDAGHLFVVQTASPAAVPEPSSLTLGIFGIPMAIVLLRARLKGGAGRRTPETQ
jgi:hypothetical protein